MAKSNIKLVKTNENYSQQINPTDFSLRIEKC
jgi:hypothetical protein